MSSQKQQNALVCPKRGKNAPCVLFIDEVDALGANRSEMRGAAGRNVINHLVFEWLGRLFAKKKVSYRFCRRVSF